MKKGFWNKALFGGNIIFLMTGAVAVVISYQIHHCPMMTQLICLVNKLFESESSSLFMDGFAILWGLPITLVLFALEFHNTYAYGVKVKRILELTFNSTLIYITFLGYALVCPIAYISMAQQKYFLVFWALTCTYIFFIAVVFFLLYYTNPKRVVSLLVKVTRSQIYKKSEKSNGAAGYWINVIDGLPISDMVVHTDYSDAADVNYMWSSLKEVFFEEKNAHKKKDKTLKYEHVVVFAWMDHILHKSGTISAWDRKRTLFLFQKIWEDVFEPINKTSFYVQIFLPLLDNVEEDTWDIVFPLWENYGKYEGVLPYILLYIEFLRMERKTDLYYSSVRLMTAFIQKADVFVNECKNWNSDLAVEFWISWCFFRDNGERLWIWGYEQFEKDIRFIAEGRKKEVCTWTMRHYLEKIT